MKITRLMVAIALLSFISGCKKNQRVNKGPGKDVKLDHHWTLEKGLVNGSDSTQTKFHYQSYILSFDNKNRYVISWLWGGLEYYEEGSWSWVGDTDLHLTYVPQKPDPFVTVPSVAIEHNYSIVKLEDQSTFWITEIQPNGEVWELHFIPQKTYGSH